MRLPRSGRSGYDFSRPAVAQFRERSMLPTVRLAPFVLLAVAAPLFAQSPAPTGCAAAVDNFFVDEVRAKVGSQKCLTCHKKGGDGADSKFVLIDPRKVEGAARDTAMRQNAAAFAAMAAAKEKDKP